ncbi:MAG: ribulose-phosphate 3-epimerase [Ruminococcus sp.]|nr:ribulose-phosphate 3-epimerase [Ruminococcus sp.]
MENIISASLLSADFCRLGDEIKRAESCGADWLHYDVMDGMFVPSISFGEPVLKCFGGTAKLPVDVHLMILDPIRYIDRYAELGASNITFHCEACDNIREVIERIHERGCTAGIAVKPATPVSEIEPYIDDIDLILIMTVEPGFGGQEFIESTLAKISQARALADKTGRKVHVQVDGGINEQTALLVKEHGANVLVSGSYLFAAEDMEPRITALRG